jgi:hypothetical protein
MENIHVPSPNIICHIESNREGEEWFLLFFWRMMGASAQLAYIYIYIYIYIYTINNQPSK